MVGRQAAHATTIRCGSDCWLDIRFQSWWTCFRSLHEPVRLEEGSTGLGRAAAVDTPIASSRHTKRHQRRATG